MPAPMAQLMRLMAAPRWELNCVSVETAVPSAVTLVPIPSQTPESSRSMLSTPPTATFSSTRSELDLVTSAIEKQQQQRFRHDVDSRGKKQPTRRSRFHQINQSMASDSDERNTAWRLPPEAEGAVDGRGRAGASPDAIRYDALLNRTAHLSRRAFGTRRR